MREELASPALVAPLVEDVLNAAHHVAAAGLEMDARIDADLHSALLRLVHAVYEHEDALELQRELEADGIRAAHVFDVTARRPPVTSYTAHVERIIETAEGVARCASAPTPEALPRYALTPVCTLVEAVTAYQGQAALAQEWERAGNRMRLIRGGQAGETQPPPPTTPPAAPPHAPHDDEAIAADELRSGAMAMTGRSTHGSDPPTVAVRGASSQHVPAAREHAALRARLR